MHEPGNEPISIGGVADEQELPVDHLERLCDLRDSTNALANEWPRGVSREFLVTTANRFQQMLNYLVAREL